MNPEQRKEQQRATANRGTERTSWTLSARSRERALAGTGTGKQQGNPGTLVGTETRDGVVYARYRAKVGTWVSASLAQHGYDKKYGKEAGYGAYSGLVAAPDGRTLKTPDRIAPGQEYLIPIGSHVSFADEPLTGYAAPRTRVDPTPWKQGGIERGAKDFLLHLRDLPYSSFELRGPQPPSRVPAQAVAHWLSAHRREVVAAEQRWHVSRLAIAGAIAWEALENPEAQSLKTVGPGKIHLEGEAGQLGWPEVVEETGRVKPTTPAMRRLVLAKPEGSINYIGAIFDFIAEVGEAKDWNIRNNPEILSQVYHSRTAEQWIDFMRTKPANAPFTIVPGTMGDWVYRNRVYLESAVGPAERW